MLKLLKYFRKRDWLMAAVLVGLIVLQVRLSLLLPDYMGKVVGLIDDPESKALIKYGDKLVNEILKNGGLMLLISFGVIGCIMVGSFLSAMVGAGLAARLRKEIFYKVESFSLEELGGFSTPSLITRITNDVTQVCMAIQMAMRFFFQAPITVVWALILIFRESSSLSWLVVGAIVLLILTVLLVFLLIVPKFAVLQRRIDRINGITRENLTGLRVVRAYNAEEYQQNKFEKANKKLGKTYLFIDRVAAVLDPVVVLVMNGLTLAIFWLGAYLVNKGEARIETLTTFMLLSNQVIMSFLMLTMVFVMIGRSLVSARRINEVLNTPLKITDGEGVFEAKSTGCVEFKNVSFKYPDAEECVLTDINFKAEKGQTVAFIGSTGSGKSTLIKLIPRFYDATDGEVLVDGVPVTQYKQENLRAIIGYVPQRGVLFSGTVKSNIVYGSTVATDEQMQKAAVVAQAADFIEGREGGFDAEIARGGQNVSGGQKQRLSIARAVVRNPEIYIFDDSFSALDYKTDKQLRAALKKNTSGATCLIVAQRIGTIMNADKILVLDNGRIVGEGTHKELMKNCSVYQEIAYSQLGKEELG